MNSVDHETTGIVVTTIAPGELWPKLSIASIDRLLHTASVTVVGTLNDMKEKPR